MTRKFTTLFAAAGLVAAAAGGPLALATPAAADGPGGDYGYKSGHRYGHYYNKRGHGYGHHKRSHRRWVGRNCRPVYRTYWAWGGWHRKFVGYRCYPRYGYRYR